ncbi:MAG: hypothetical protein HZA50_04105 [Planctomycetes bacterium]|nr:hypothetical protein [Planctomycetota bacterium]
MRIESVLRAGTKNPSMAEIRVESIEALRRLRTAIVKFIDVGRSAMIDAEMDLQQTMQWVQNEQTAYWKGQIQKRTEAVVQARQALRDKNLFRTTISSSVDTIDEEKALARAGRALEEAERKSAASQRWAHRLPQESAQYNGAAQRMRNQTEIRLPESIARLDQMAESLEAYLALEAPAGTAASAAIGEDSSGVREPAARSMSRGEDAAASEPRADAPEPPGAKENKLDAGPDAPRGNDKS